MNEISLTNKQLERYSRHILLPEIDLDGQNTLFSSRVLIIGAGGLASPAAMYLASSGVGHITIFDDDSVDLGNLQRQIAFKTKDIGKNKAQQIKATLNDINPDTQVDAINQRADNTLLIEAIGNTDVVLDASDNFETRFAINKTCVALKKPLVSGAAIRFAGQVSVFDAKDTASPCYHCLYGEEEQIPRESCAERGVFAPLVGIIGSIQAAETLKLLLGIGNNLTGQLLQIDSLSMIPRVTKLSKDPKCPICST